MENTHNSKQLLIISSIALITSFATLVMVFSMYTNNKIVLQTYAKDREDKKAHDEMKAVASQQTTMSPDMAEGDELIVNCTSTQIASKMIQANSMSIVCGNWNKKDSKGRGGKKRPKAYRCTVI